MAPPTPLPAPPHPFARGAALTMEGGFVVLTIEVPGLRLPLRYCLTTTTLSALRDSALQVAGDAALHELARERGTSR